MGYLEVNMYHPGIVASCVSEIFHASGAVGSLVGVLYFFFFFYLAVCYIEELKSTTRDKMQGALGVYCN